jgi:hypothetical protein
VFLFFVVYGYYNDYFNFVNLNQRFEKKDGILMVPDSEDLVAAHPGAYGLNELSPKQNALGAL